MGFETQNLSVREAADLRFRPRIHWDQRLGCLALQNTVFWIIRLEERPDSFLSSDWKFSETHSR